MTMPPWVSKLSLTVHIASSVGWLGAVAAFLGLAVTGISSGDVQLVRSVYLAMNAVGLFVVVPLSLASLVSGLVQSLGTKWGLFRHWWVIFKLFINVFSVFILMMYTQTLGYLADIAGRSSFSSGDLAALRNPTAVLHSGAALVFLLAATVLAVYKPRGLTGYGRRKQQQRAAPPAQAVG